MTVMKIKMSLSNFKSTMNQLNEEQLLGQEVFEPSISTRDLLHPSPNDMTEEKISQLKKNSINFLQECLVPPTAQ